MIKDAMQRFWDFLQRRGEKGINSAQLEIEFQDLPTRFDSIKNQIARCYPSLIDDDFFRRPDVTQRLYKVKETIFFSLGKATRDRTCMISEIIEEEYYNFSSEFTTRPTSDRARMIFDKLTRTVDS